MIFRLVGVLCAVIWFQTMPSPAQPQLPLTEQPSVSTSLPAAAAPGVQVHIQYIEPRNPSHRAILERLQALRVLEQLKEFLAPLRFPVPLTVRTMTCGLINAYYASGVVTICYEFIEFARKLVPNREATCELGITPEDVITGQFVDILLHETAHALFSLFRIPVFGREEEAADQLAAFMLLQFGPDVAKRTITATAIFFRELAKQQTSAQQTVSSASEREQLEMSRFASEHGLPAQRFYNLLCIAYGHDQQLFGDFVGRGLLPISRAARCPSEYRQVAHAFRTLVHPHIDLPQFVRGQTLQRQWLPSSSEKCEIKTEK
jgi:hypothetical protein